MKKFIMGILTICFLVTGCQSTVEMKTFSFGDDLVFVENEGTTRIDLEKSSDIVKEKHKELSSIINSEEVLTDIVAVTTTTANILESMGIRPTGAPESQSLSSTLSSMQYTLGSNSKVNKSKVLNIGSAIAPNTEAIIELNPKLVLYSDAMPKTDFLKNIENTNIKVSALAQSDYVDMFVLLDVVSEVSKDQNEKVKTIMNEMVKSLKATKEIVEKANAKDKTIAILQVAEGSVQVNNETTVLGRIAKALGMKNVFANSENGQLNKEQLLSLNPDYIIYYTHGMSGTVSPTFEKEIKSETSVYRELKAVKENRAFPVAGDDFVFAASVDFEIIKAIRFLAEKFYE